MPLTCNRSKEIQLHIVTGWVWTLEAALWSLTSLSGAASAGEVCFSRELRLNIVAIIHVWKDLMTVSTAPPPACLTLYWTETNYKFPAHFLEFSWYQKSIFVLYLNNRLKLFLSGQFLIISRVREREQTKHYVKQIYNCFLCLLLPCDTGIIFISLMGC